MTTVASGIKVKVNKSPAFNDKLSRISLGIVVCPLLVSVAMFDIGNPFILTFYIIVRNQPPIKLFFENSASRGAVCATHDPQRPLPYDASCFNRQFCSPSDPLSLS
jgi:hypothetical protein